MFARAAASRRAALTILATPRIAPRRLPVGTRSTSFWPFRKKPDPTLPVYFPKEKAQRRMPWRRARYALFTLLVYYAMSQVYMSFVLDPLLDWAEAEWDSMSEKEKRELEQQADSEEDEPIIFLPFPFTTKQIPQPPYKGTDPEWQEFVKVNKDPKKQKEIKTTLAETVRRSIEVNPTFVRLMGSKKMKVRKMWLDIIYPPGPPPKHYISGLILDDDGLFWGDRSIEAMAAHQLNAIMYPKAVALATWTFCNVLFQRTKDDISKALGFEGSKKPDTSWQSVMITRGRPGTPLGTGKPSPSSILAPPNTQAKASQSGPSSQGLPDLPGFFKKTGEGAEVPMSASMMQAFQAASFTLVNHWKPPEQNIHRGCIRVDGMVELQGKAAVMVVFVVGWYDPKAKKYANIQAHLKHLVQSQQRPLGGA